MTIRGPRRRTVATIGPVATLKAVESDYVRLRRAMREHLESDRGLAAVYERHLAVLLGESHGVKNAALAAREVMMLLFGV